VLAAQNSKQLEQLAQRRVWLLVGVIGTLILPVVVSLLPDRFPPPVLPLAYTVALREAAKNAQGKAIATYRTAGGALGSWWTVVGLGIAGAVLLFGLFACAVMLFPSAFQDEDNTPNQSVERTSAGLVFHIQSR
jgi:hypothetical protein